MCVAWSVGSSGSVCAIVPRESTDSSLVVLEEAYSDSIMTKAEGVRAELVSRAAALKRE